jgi:hypothetical protein
MAECIAYVQGFHAGVDEVSVRSGGKIYCLPRGVTYQQGINVILSYADRNPQQTHLDFGYLVATAFLEAFPCR